MTLWTIFFADVITRRGVSEAATFPREEDTNESKNDNKSTDHDADPPTVVAKALSSVVDDIDVTTHVLIVIVDGDVNVLLLVILQRAFL